MILWSPHAGSRNGTSAQKAAGERRAVHGIAVPIRVRTELQGAIAEQVVAAAENLPGSRDGVRRVRKGTRAGRL